MNLRQCYQTPKYMRRCDQSFIAFGPPDVDYIADPDTDVSYDGKKWFHLLGSIYFTQFKLDEPEPRIAGM